MKLNSQTGGNIEVADSTFGAEFNQALVHQVVTAFRAKARRGTKAQKNRSAVRGGGAKPWRQKGTGRARAGTIRSPIWVGGGRAFAAKPRDYSQKVNRKMYRGALSSIFSELVRQERLVVVDSCEMDAPKTRNLVATLNNFDAKDVLIVSEDVSENLYLAARNLHWVGLVDVATIDPAILVAYDKVVISSAALARIEAMELGAMVPLDIHEAEIGGRTDCEGGEPSIRFMADGGAVGTDICLTRGDLFARYRPDWLTGRLVETEPGR